MPEGPEIRRAAQAVQRGVAGEPLRSAVVESVSARSKAMLTRISTCDVLCSHSQFYGEWVVDRPDEPLRSSAIWRVMETPAQRAVMYSETGFAWLCHGNEDAHPCLATFGGRELSVCIGCQDVFPPPDELRH